VGLRGIFSHFKLDETAARSGTKTDSQFISCKVGLTRFIPDRPLEAWKIYRNPDRYTSDSLGETRAPWGKTGTSGRET